MTETGALILIGLTFLLAGGVKGVIGLGLPSVSLAILTATLGLHPAMALLVVPSLVTNVWQAVVGGNGVETVKRIWPLLLFATVTVWVGAMTLHLVDVALLSALLGILVAIYSTISLLHPKVAIPRRWEPWAGPAAGAVNGVLTGMTGSFVFPGVLYLQAIGLPRDAFIQAMGMLFTVSTLALGIALRGNDLLTAELGAISAAAVVPAVIGMMIGQRLRKRMSETLFRRVFFVALLALGLYIVARSLI
jgi:uncharacterized membrane protein YfcA